jgi:hypothetical protein
VSTLLLQILSELPAIDCSNTALEDLLGHIEKLEKQLAAWKIRAYVEVYRLKLNKCDERFYNNQLQDLNDLLLKQGVAYEEASNALIAAKAKLAVCTEETVVAKETCRKATDESAGFKKINAGFLFSIEKCKVEIAELTEKNKVLHNEVELFTATCHSQSLNIKSLEAKIHELTVNLNSTMARERSLQGELENMRLSYDEVTQNRIRSPRQSRYATMRGTMRAGPSSMSLSPHAGTKSSASTSPDAAVGGGRSSMEYHSGAGGVELKLTERDLYNRTLDELSSSLATANQELEILRNSKEESRQRWEQTNATIADRDGKIASLSAELAASKRTIEELQGSVDGIVSSREQAMMYSEELQHQRLDNLEFIESCQNYNRLLEDKMFGQSHADIGNDSMTLAASLSAELDTTRFSLTSLQSLVPADAGINRSADLSLPKYITELPHTSTASGTGNYFAGNSGENSYYYRGFLLSPFASSVDSIITLQQQQQNTSSPPKKKVFDNIKGRTVEARILDIVEQLEDRIRCAHEDTTSLQMLNSMDELVSAEVTLERQEKLLHNKQLLERELSELEVRVYAINDELFLMYKQLNMLKESVQVGYAKKDQFVDDLRYREQHYRNQENYHEKYHMILQAYKLTDMQLQVNLQCTQEMITAITSRRELLHNLMLRVRGIQRLLDRITKGIDPATSLSVMESAELSLAMEVIPAHGHVNSAQHVDHQQFQQYQEQLYDEHQLQAIDFQHPYNDHFKLQHGKNQDSQDGQHDQGPDQDQEHPESMHGGGNNFDESQQFLTVGMPENSLEDANEFGYTGGIDTHRSSGRNSGAGPTVAFFEPNEEGGNAFSRPRSEGRPRSDGRPRSEGRPRSGFDNMYNDHNFASRTPRQSRFSIAVRRRDHDDETISVDEVIASVYKQYGISAAIASLGYINETYWAPIEVAASAVIVTRLEVEVMWPLILKKYECMAYFQHRRTVQRKELLRWVEDFYELCGYVPSRQQKEESEVFQGLIENFRMVEHDLMTFRDDIRRVISAYQVKKKIFRSNLETYSKLTKQKYKGHMHIQVNQELVDEILKNLATIVSEDPYEVQHGVALTSIEDLLDDHEYDKATAVRKAKKKSSKGKKSNKSKSKKSKKQLQQQQQSRRQEREYREEDSSEDMELFERRGGRETESEAESETDREDNVSVLSVESAESIGSLSSSIVGVPHQLPGSDSMSSSIEHQNSSTSLVGYESDSNINIIQVHTAEHVVEETTGPSHPKKQLHISTEIAERDYLEATNQFEQLQVREPVAAPAVPLSLSSPIAIPPTVSQLPVASPATGISSPVASAVLRRSSRLDSSLRTPPLPTIEEDHDNDPEDSKHERLAKAMLTSSKDEQLDRGSPSSNMFAVNVIVNTDTGGPQYELISDVDSTVMDSIAAPVAAAEANLSDGSMSSMLILSPDASTISRMFDPSQSEQEHISTDQEPEPETPTPAIRVSGFGHVTNPTEQLLQEALSHLAECQVEYDKYYAVLSDAMSESKTGAAHLDAVKCSLDAWQTLMATKRRASQMNRKSLLVSSNTTPETDKLVLDGLQSDVEAMKTEYNTYLEAEKVARAAFQGPKSRHDEAQARVDELRRIRNEEIEAEQRRLALIEEELNRAQSAMSSRGGVTTPTNRKEIGEAKIMLLADCAKHEADMDRLKLYVEDSFTALMELKSENLTLKALLSQWTNEFYRLYGRQPLMSDLKLNEKIGTLVQRRSEVKDEIQLLMEKREAAEVLLAKSQSLVRKKRNKIDRLTQMELGLRDRLYSANSMYGDEAFGMEEMTGNEGPVDAPPAGVDIASNESSPRAKPNKSGKSSKKEKHKKGKKSEKSPKALPTPVEASDDTAMAQTERVGPLLAPADNSVKASVGTEMTDAPLVNQLNAEFRSCVEGQLEQLGSPVELAGYRDMDVEMFSLLSEQETSDMLSELHASVPVKARLRKLRKSVQSLLAQPVNANVSLESTNPAADAGTIEKTLADSETGTSVGQNTTFANTEAVFSDIQMFDNTGPRPTSKGSSRKSSRNNTAPTAPESRRSRGSTPPQPTPASLMTAYADQYVTVVVQDLVSILAVRQQQHLQQQVEMEIRRKEEERGAAASSRMNRSEPEMGEIATDIGISDATEFEISPKLGDSEESFAPAVHSRRTPASKLAAVAEAAEADGLDNDDDSVLSSNSRQASKKELKREIKLIQAELTELVSEIDKLQEFVARLESEIAAAKEIKEEHKPYVVDWANRFRETYGRNPLTSDKDNAQDEDLEHLDSFESAKLVMSKLKKKLEKSESLLEVYQSKEQELAVILEDLKEKYVALRN